MEPQVLSHFSTELITCPYPEPAEIISIKQTIILGEEWLFKHSY
jgi:hypothetical protein